MSRHLRETEESDIAARVASYNARCGSGSERIRIERSADGLACGGPLRLHWDVRGSLSLVESDGSTPLNGHYAFLGAEKAAGEDPAAEDGDNEVFAGVRLRRRHRWRQMIPADWRRSVNGHAFTGPSCVRPEPGQSVQVLADVGDRVHQVIARLFTKYLIRDPAEAYCIAVLAPDGWELILSPLDCPLRVRLSLGPDEAHSGKLLVREAGRAAPRQSILQLASMPTPLLRQLLESLAQEEATEVAATRARYRLAKSAMEAAMLRWLSGGGSGGNAAAGTLRGEHMSHL